ncbi:hypothetical protein C7H62_1883 [Mesoflavibacter sp. HG96]|nr:hypothetical protein C7H62_1883 [Mesoflavibacter sp. HG96]QIJ92420.1 hypothetical protein C7H56_1883 [Mesoflavibacter sp. HG37]
MSKFLIFFSNVKAVKYENPKLIKLWVFTYLANYLNTNHQTILGKKLNF